MNWGRYVTVILLLLGVEFIAASRPFGNEPTPTEFIMFICGCILLSIYNAILWDRSE